MIVGAQWGDEGKGKIVDLLAQDSDLVCRYQGGPNAGHTIVVDGETYKIRQIPSGVLRGKTCVIGAGCVVDPEVFLAEVDELEGRGHSTADVHVSGEAHLIMPWHVAIDRASERRLGELQIGTTRRGIGPCYADKAMRLGIRVQDLLDAKILRQKIEVALAEKNLWLERVYGEQPLELEELADTLEGHAQRMRAYVSDTSLLVDRALRDGRDVLLEGGQGTLLDLDHGTYPFVTSSSTVAANAATGVGIGPNRIDQVLGVAKAYVTRVGEGPFPTEIQGPDQERVRDLGGEFGTVTGRVRRCGWLDLVALRYAVRLNGITSLALTKLDVLSHFAELPVCVAYRLRDGTETAEFPAHQSDFHHCRPVYETLAGWEEPLTDGLPDAARAYADFVEQALGVEISLVGTGSVDRRTPPTAQCRAGTGTSSRRSRRRSPPRGARRRRPRRTLIPRGHAARRVCRTASSVLRPVRTGRSRPPRPRRHAASSSPPRSPDAADDDAVGTSNAAHLAQAGLRVGEEVHDQLREDGVEPVVGEGKLFGRGEPDVGTRNPFSACVDKRLGRVNRGHALRSHELGQRPRQAAGAAADVEHAVAAVDSRRLD